MGVCCVRRGVEKVCGGGSRDSFVVEDLGVCRRSHRVSMIRADDAPMGAYGGLAYSSTLARQNLTYRFLTSLTESMEELYLRCTGQHNHLVRVRLPDTITRHEGSYVSHCINSKCFWAPKNAWQMVCFYCHHVVQAEHT